MYLTCIILLQENTNTRSVSEENRTTIVRSVHENSEPNKDDNRTPPISVDESTTTISTSNTSISTPMDTTNTELLYDTTSSSSIILRNNTTQFTTLQEEPSRK